MTPLTKPITRRSATLASSYGPDRNRRLVITLIPGNGGAIPDLIEVRPIRTKRGKRIAVDDLWNYLQRCEANMAMMKRLAERKKAKAEKRERARLNRGIRRGLSS